MEAAWRERWLVGLEAFLGVWAIAGAVGLATGRVDLGDSVDDVPASSPVLAGLALGVLVGVPAIVVAAGAWRGRRWARPLHGAVGWMLIGWIVVQVAFIGLVSWLQPVFVLYGAVIVVLALQGVRGAPAARAVTRGRSRARPGPGGR